VKDFLNEGSGSPLQGRPAVLAACAVGAPDERVGERIKCFVVLKDGVKGVTGYDLTHWCFRPSRVLQDIQLHRVSGHAAEIEGRQAAGGARCRVKNGSGTKTICDEHPVAETRVS